MKADNDFIYAKYHNNRFVLSGRQLVAGTIATNDCRDYITLVDPGATNTVTNVYLMVWGLKNDWRQAEHSHTLNTIQADIAIHTHTGTASAHTHDFTEDYLVNHKHQMDLAHFYLRLYGGAAGAATTKNTLTNSSGTAAGTTAAQTVSESNGLTSSTGTITGTTDSTGDGVSTEVPNNIQIWTNNGGGWVNRTVTIGDPNGKGGTMFSGTTWGVGGTVEFDTGMLDLTSFIDLTADTNMIEFRSSGDCGSGGLQWKILLL